MILEIPVSKTFECPEGAFRAVLSEVREQAAKDGGGTQLRLVFLPKVPKKKGKVVTVGKNYEASLRPASELRNMLECWLGQDFLTSQQDGRLDIQKLVGAEADIVTRHFKNPNFDKPFVNLVGVYPPGTQTSTHAATNAPALEKLGTS